MATVRLSYALWNTIERNLEKLFAARLKAASADLLNQEIGDRLYEAIYDKEKIALARQIPEWVNTTSSLRINSPDGSFDFPLSTEQPSPRRMDHYGVDLDKNPVLLEKARAIYGPKLKILNTLKIEQKAMIAGIKTTFDSCGSLRQLEQLWPSCLEFIDDDTRKRHFAQSEKQKRSENKELDQDTQLLLIKSRLING